MKVKYKEHLIEAIQLKIDGFSHNVPDVINFFDSVEAFEITGGRGGIKLLVVKRHLSRIVVEPYEIWPGDYIVKTTPFNGEAGMAPIFNVYNEFQFKGRFDEA